MTAPPDLSLLGRSALSYAGLGWRVFTLYPRDKKPMNLCAGCLERLPAKDTDTGIAACRSCGRKHHDGRNDTPHELGLYVATTDPALITAWWTKEPKANIGIRCGDGLVVLDCDVPTEGKTKDGEATLAALEARHGTLPVTPRQRTGEHNGRRGAQYAFKVDEPVKNSANKVGPGLDVRGDGGYIVAAPSMHPSGVKYEWDADRKPSKLERAPMPSWLLNLAKGEQKLSEVASVKRPKPQRPDTPGVAAKWLNAALDYEYERAASAPKGERNQALNFAAFKLGQLIEGAGLDEQTVRATLVSAAEASGWAGEEGPQSVETVIASGIAAGRKVPRSAPEDKPAERPPYQPPQSKTAKVRVVGGTEAVAPDATPEGKPIHRTGWIVPFEDLTDHVEFKENTRILQPKVMRNAVACLLYRAELADLFILNKRSQKVIVTRQPIWTVNGGPYPRHLGDADIIGALTHLESLGLRLLKGSVADAVYFAAKAREFDPVMEKLTSFLWDEKPRLDHWLVDHLGADDNSFTRTVGAKWLIAACARIMRPGCKFDHMLVLVGDQGLEKSTVFRVIAETLSSDVYTDRLSPFKDKDSMIELMGKVIVEMAELAAFRGATNEQIKRFLSAQDDDLRLPWDRTTSNLKRGCVFGGTVNDDGLGFLTDPTGSRRFWPVTVTKPGAVRIAAEAPQLWAEALSRFRAGEHWWIEDAEVERLQGEATARHTEQDVWAGAIDTYISTQPFVQVERVLRELGVTTDKQSERDQRRVAHHLRKRGWLPRAKRVDGKVEWGWFPPKGVRRDLFEDAAEDGDQGPEER